MARFHLTGPVLLVALLAVLLPAGSTAQVLEAAPGKILLKEKLPAETLMYMALPDFEESWEGFKTLPLYKLWEEKEVQEFLKQPLALLHQYVGEGKKEMAREMEQAGLPVTVEEVMAIRPGSMQMALVGAGGPGEIVRFAAVLEMGAGIPALNKLVGFGLGKMKAQVAMMEKYQMRGSPKLEFTQVGGYQFVVMDATPAGGPFKSLTMAYRDGTFLMASSRALADRILGGPAEGSLAGTSVFKQSFADLRGKGAALELFLRPAATLKTLASFLTMIPERDFQEFWQEHGDKVHRGLEASGLMDMQAMAISSTYTQGKATLDSFTMVPAPRRGFMTMMDGPPINREHLAWVPKDAVSLSLGAMPVAKVVQTLIDILGAADKELAARIPEQLEKLKKRTGVALKADFLDLVGGEFLMYSQASSGIGSPPPMVVMLEVKQQEKFVNSMETLLVNLSEGEVTLEKAKDPASGVQVWSLDFDLSGLGGGGPMPMNFNIASMFKPSFAFHQGFMVLGFSSRNVIKAVRLMDGKGKSILGDEEFKSYLAKCPERATALSFGDIKETVRSTYEMVSSLVQFLPVDDLPIDLALLPGSDTVCKHFFPSFGYSITTEKGTLSRMSSPIGPEILAGAGLAVAGAAMVFTTARGAEMGPPMTPPKVVVRPVEKPKEEEAAPPKAEPALGKAMKLRIIDDFDEIAGALMVYKLEINDFPDKLDKLLAPLPGYTQPCLTKKALLDPWGNLYHYQKSGKGYKIWSFGPNGKDDGGKGDDIVRMH